MLARLQRKENIPQLLVGEQTYTTTVEINMIVPQKFRIRSALTPSHTILVHIPKRYSILPQGH